MCRPARWLIHFSLSVATSLRHAINLWSSCRRLLVGFGFTEFFCGSNFVSKPCPGHWIPSYWVLPGFQVLWCRYPFEAELSMIGSRFYLVLCFFTEFESLPRILLATVVSGEKGLLRRSRRRFRSTRPQGYAVCFCRSMGWFSFCPPPHGPASSTPTSSYRLVRPRRSSGSRSTSLWDAQLFWPRPVVLFYFGSFFVLLGFIEWFIFDYSF